MSSSNSQDIILDIQKLNISFKTKDGIVPAVEGLDLKIYKGELLALVGESGCGKSITSLAVMGLLEHPAVVKADHMYLNGMDMAGLSKNEIRKLRGTEMSMIFQDPLTSLNPLYTVGNQISEQFLTHIPGCTRAEAKQRSLDMLNKVGIPSPETMYNNYPHQLSGGMRQRVMIAIALCCNPKLLIADEPTTALDVTIQAQILHLMRELIKDFDTSILFITHDLGVVAEMADRVTVMYAGQIVEQNEVFSLFGSPQHPYTKGLLSSTLGMQNQSSTLHPIPGAVPSLSKMPAGCRFNPRCPYVQDRCKNEMPDLREIADGNSVRCFFCEK